MVLPPTSSSTCYKDYCNDPSLTGLTSISFYKTKLGAIYASWSTEAILPLGHDELVREVIVDMSQSMPGDLLVFVTDSTHGAGWDEHWGSLFGYVGDVVDQDIKIVELDNDIFDSCLPSYIQNNVDAQIQLLEADTNIQLVAAAGLGNTTKAHGTRKCMFIPAPQMPYILIEPPRNARQTLEVLVAAMRSLYLKVVQERTGKAFYNPVSVARARQHNILYTQLLSLSPTANGRDPVLHRLLGAMREVRDGVLDGLTDHQIGHTK